MRLAAIRVHALHVSSSALAAVSLVLLAGCGPTPGTVGGTSFGQLPGGVKAAAEAERGKGRITTVETEVTGDRTLFAIGYAPPSGAEQEVYFTHDGTVVRRQVTVPLDAVPPAVQEALRQEAGSRGRVVRVQKSTEGPGAPPYEGRVTIEDRTIDLELSDSGHPFRRRVNGRLEQ